MNEQMNKTTFGVEIEMTGITRQHAALITAKFFNLNNLVQHKTSYDTYYTKDAHARDWSFMRDGSIEATDSQGNRVYNSDYSVELVTPVLTYNEDMETLQQIVRELKKAGAVVNKSCGIHVHIGGDRHNNVTIKNYVNYISARQELFFNALNVLEYRKHYCAELSESFVESVNNARRPTMTQLENFWYRGYAGSRYEHYNQSRYHFLNLHSFFNMKHHTIEIRGFNSTLHAGEIRAYVVLCLAINDFCLNAKRVSNKPVQMENPKFSMRHELHRLNLVGDEFKNVRKHLMKHLEGNTSRRYGYVA